MHAPGGAARAGFAALAGIGVALAAVGGPAAPAGAVTPGGWSVTGSLLTARSHAASALLPDGAVLVAGGWTSASAAPTSTAELYDPSTGQWSATAGSMPVAVADAAAALLPDGEVLVVGGDTGPASSPAPTGDAELFNPSTGTWSPAAPLPGGLAVAGASATLLTDGEVLVAGGLTGSGGTTSTTADSELYVPASNSWISAPSMTLGVAGAVSARLPDGEVLVAGGINQPAGGSPSVTSTSELYDPSLGPEGAWSATSSMLTATAYAASTPLADREVLVAGGETSPSGVATGAAEYFSPSDDAWTATGALPVASYGAAAARLASGEVVYAGGLVDSSGDATAAAEYYSPASGAWSATSPLLQPSGFAAAARLPGGEVLLAGGQSGPSAVTGVAELYEPPGTAPAITSAPSLKATVGTATSFTVTATGSPSPILSISGALPSGLSFTSNGNGTATISGTPAQGTAGTYTLTLTASNGVGTPASQTLTITVTANIAPAITSAPSLKAVVGKATSFTVTATGSPQPKLTVAGTLPVGLAFKDNGNGTATISGTPAQGTAGTYTLTLTASNGVGTPASQTLTITVTASTVPEGAIVFSSSASAQLEVHVYAKFTIQAKGYPRPQLTATGTLPKGMRLVPAYGGSVLWLAGIPWASAVGTYSLDVTATNGVASPAHQTVLITVSRPNIPPQLSGPSVLPTRVGSYAKLRVDASGSPVPTLALRGILPAGLRFVTKPGVPFCFIAGTPAAVGVGTYDVVVTALNGVGAPASHAVQVTVAPRQPVPPPTPSPTPSPTPLPTGRVGGYWYVTTTGQVIHQGDAVLYRSSSRQGPRDVVAMAERPGGGGYWLASSFGGVFNFGDAGFYGSLVHSPPSSPVVAFAPTPDGRGYWLVTRSGQVHPFGDAVSYGSPSGQALPAPVSAFAPTPDGRGYWVVTMSGAVYPYGDATGYSTLSLNPQATPVVAFAPTPDGRGYWLVTSNGAVYAFGDAASYGSPLPRRIPPVVAFAPTPDGRGYWLVTSRGNVFNYGDAAFYGSSAHTLLPGRVVGFSPSAG